MSESRVATGLSRREMATVGAWALAYFAAYAVAFSLPDAAQFFTAVWPAAGVGLAALLLSPRALWPWLLLAFAVVGVGANVGMEHRGVVASVGFMVADIAESFACALLITRVGGRDVRFDRIAPVGALLGSALGVNAVTACLGAGWALLVTHVPFGDVWWTWYVSNGLGILVVAPLILAWAHAGETNASGRPARLVESVIFLSVWCAVILMAINPSSALGLRPYLAIALLVWPAFRLRRPVVPTALALLTLIAIIDAILHPNPNALSGRTLAETLFNIQAFVATAAAVGFVMAAAMTEAYVATQEARVGETRYRVLFEQAGDANLLLELKPDGPPVIRDVNSAALQTTGYTRDGLIGEPISLLEPALSAEMIRDRGQLAASGSAIFEAQHLRKDGSLFDVEVRATEFVIHGTRMLMTTERDVTERKKADEELRESRALFFTAFDKSPLLKTISDLSTGRYLEVNDSFCAVSGFSRDEAVGKTSAELGWIGVDERRRLLLELQEHGKVAGLELDLRAKGGHPVICRFWGDVIPSAEGDRLFSTAEDFTERKQTELALEKSAALLELTRRQLSMSQQLGGAGTWVFDVPANEIWASLGGANLFGLPAGEGQYPVAQIEACIPERERVHQALVDLISEERPYDLEYLINPADGSPARYVHSIGGLERDPSGKPRRALGFVQDITERKQAAEALERERAVLAESQALGHLGSWEYHADTRETSWSAEQCRIYGLALQAKSPPYGEMLKHHIHPDDAALLDKTFGEALRTVSVFELEHRIVRPDGSVRVVFDRAQPHLDEHGTLVKYTGSTLDITDRKLAEDRLRLSEERFTLSMQATNDGLWDWDTTTDAGYFSPGYYTMLGYEPGSFASEGRTWQSLIHPVDADAALRASRDCVEGRTERFNIEYRMKAKDGTWRWILGRGACAARDAQGRALRLLGTHVDITARKAAEQELERLQAQLGQAEKLESVGRLAGGVAHDYNNMLAVIIGNLELGLLRTDVPAGLREDLMEVHKAATHSAEITQQLLTFARKQVIQPKTLDLNATVAHSLKMLQRLIGERVQFTVHPAADLWPVRMDSTQVEQVLTNLCLNARDAITGTGTVVVTTANRVVDARQCENLTEATPGAYVQLTVTDSGRGMSPGVLAHVFEPFFTTKGVGEGSGLGLASVHGAVRQNGGFVVASSVEGAGATFDIYLPRSQISAAGSLVSEPVAPTRTAHATILVVEDEPGVLRMSARALESQGYAVLRADGPREAIRLSREHVGAIALVLTDVQMPEMSGPDLAAALRLARPRIKHIFMSAYPMPDGEADGAMDPATFLAKPFSLVDLTAKVREVLDGG